MPALLRCFPLIGLIVSVFSSDVLLAEEPINLGTRRELFVDDYLIGSLTGDAKQVLQQPTPHEVVLTTDKPWEGNTCAYYTIFQDGDKYRMYYRGSHYNTETRKPTHPEVTCYAESSDGIHWTKPELGLYEFDGSKANNIVWTGMGTHCFTVFKDANPECKPEAKYKAISRGGPPEGKKGLYVFQSPDAIHWSRMHDEPVITDGAFDSQNLAFWDPVLGKYRCYFRDFRKVRDIKWCVSDDFINWTAPEFLTYPGVKLEHLYTNAIRNEPRAPHILIGFPTRFLPDEGQRVEPTFMSSRDGHTFHRWLDPVIPETAPEDRTGNRSNYMTWGLLELPDKPDEYSVYATEAYYTGPDSRVRRFTYRKDGYVAVKAQQAGKLLTREFVFDGKQLLVNAKVEEGGELKVQILSGSRVMTTGSVPGDGIDQKVAWPSNADVGRFAGMPVRLEFELKNAELYSFQFQP